MKIKDQLRDTLDDFANDYLDRLSDENETCQTSLTEYTDQILKLIEDSLPEEKVPFHSEGDWVESLAKAQVQGYNQALKDIKEKLDES